jgi:uncharacterized membrane protein YphA (DoxX/SURF4 family)
MKGKAAKMAGWAVLAVTALFFLNAGIQKLAGEEQMAGTFRLLGLPDGVRLAIGALEMILGILLIVPRTTLPAAAGLCVLMTGAVGAELALGNGWHALLPGQWLAVSAGIAAVKWRRAKRKAQAPGGDQAGRSRAGSA